MNIMPINSPAFSAGLKASMLSKNVNRKLLHATKSDLKALAGSNIPSFLKQENKKAKAEKWLTAYVAGNTAIAASLSQIPGADIAALAGVEAVMALHIFKGIYKFDLSKSALESLTAAAKGATAGLTAFFLASKSVTWIPFIGNCINGATAFAITGALGKWLISKAEEMDKIQKIYKDREANNKRMKEFFKQMEQEAKKAKKTK